MSFAAFALYALQSGAVATAERYATEAAAAVLEEGGNAIDAAITASFALAVTYPTAGNLGGGGFLLYREPSGLAWYLDFRECAPAKAHAGMYQDEGGCFTFDIRVDGNLIRIWIESRSFT